MGLGEKGLVYCFFKVYSGVVSGWFRVGFGLGPGGDPWNSIYSSIFHLGKTR